MNREIKAKRESQLAFWINAYNAVTIRGILREYPTTSIRSHTPRLFGYHIWKDLKLYVGGKPYSLDQIEYEVLRQMDEPRIHFATVCASISYPNLLNEAYVPGELEIQLAANAKDFFRASRTFATTGLRIGLICRPCLIGSPRILVVTNPRCSRQSRIGCGLNRRFAQHVGVRQASRTLNTTGASIASESIRQDAIALLRCILAGESFQISKVDLPNTDAIFWF